MKHLECLYDLGSGRKQPTISAMAVRMKSAVVFKKNKVYSICGWDFCCHPPGLLATLRYYKAALVLRSPVWVFKLRHYLRLDAIGIFITSVAYTQNIRITCGGAADR